MVPRNGSGAGGAGGRFSGRPVWWWLSAAVAAVAVVGSVLLLTLPV